LDDLGRLDLQISPGQVRFGKSEGNRATGQPVLRSAQDYKVPSGRDIPAPWFGSEMSEIHEK